MLHNEVIRAIEQRRSVRRYRGQQIAPEELETILRCAILAPSASNTQPWRFTVVENQALLDEIDREFKRQAALGEVDWIRQLAAREGYHVFFHAPTVVVVSGPSRDNINPAYATENMVLAAQSLGIGSVILGLPNRAFDGDRGPELLAKLNIPEGFTPQVCVSLGYPEGESYERPRNFEVINYVR